MFWISERRRQHANAVQLAAAEPSGSRVCATAGPPTTGPILSSPRARAGGRGARAAVSAHDLLAVGMLDRRRTHLLALSDVAAGFPNSGGGVPSKLDRMSIRTTNATNTAPIKMGVNALVPSRSTVNFRIQRYIRDLSRAPTHGLASGSSEAVTTLDCLETSAEDRSARALLRAVLNRSWIWEIMRLGGEMRSAEATGKMPASFIVG